MKILVVSETYYPLIGGIPEHIFHLSCELRKRGHTVKILTANFGRHKNRDDNNIIRIGRGLIIRANKSFSRFTLGWRISDKVQKVCSVYRPDIIHIHGSLAPMLPILALRHSRAVNVATFHAGHQRALGYMIFRPLLMPYLRKLAGLVAVSNTAEFAMSKYFKGTYRIIPNGVDTEGFNPQVVPLPQFKDKRKKILYMNRLEPKKGLPHLLKALTYVKEQIPDVLLLVAGSGPFAQYYKKLVAGSISENVLFLGEVPGQPVYLRASLYQSCDLFCAPSIGYESFGIVLLEAMACEKPVVASAIEGYREVLGHGIEGLLVPAKDDKKLASAILRILNSKKLAETMGKAGRAKALGYSWPKVALEVENFYRELSKERRIIKTGAG